MKMAKVLRKKTTLIARCGITESAAERMQGLLPRASLAGDEALWFPRNTSIHTFFMKFAIDVAFLDGKGRVIALYHSLRPWRHTWIHLFAAGGGTLEASAGLFMSVGLQKGEVLEICPFS